MDKLAKLLETPPENRLVGVLALLAAALLAYPAPFTLGAAVFLPLHTAMEALTIVVASLVFATGLNSHRKQTSFNLMLLSCAFLAVGLIDFGHTLSYSGMPDLVTPSGAEKAIHFWLAARLTAAAALLAAALLPWNRLIGDRTLSACIAGTLALSGAVYWLVLFHQDSLPRVFSAETGLTPFKKGVEYLIVATHAATALLFYRRRDIPQPYDATLLYAAVCVMGLGELFFAAYDNMTDLLNLFGHLYKVIAYFLIYRAIFVYGIRQPHRDLQQTEERLERVLEGSLDGFWDNDLRSGAVEYSGRWAEMLGYRPEEIAPRRDSWVSLIHPDDRERVMKIESDYIGGHLPAYEAEFRMLAKSGEWRHIRSRGRITARDAQGRPLRISGAHSDITARHQAENALRASEERYRLIVESMLEGVWVLDSHGTTVYANQRMAEMLGYAVNDMPGRPFFDFIAEEQREAAKYYRERRSRGISERHEFPLRRKDGEELWASVSSTPLTDEKGEFIGALAIVSDITERKRAEREIARLEHRNELILHAAGMGICGMDAAGRVTFVNPVAAKLLGYDAEEIAGRSLHLISHYRKSDGSPYPAEECPIQDAIRRGVSHFERDELFWHKDGTPFPVEYTSTPIMEGETIAGAVLIFSDICERKRLEKNLHQWQQLVEHASWGMAIGDLGKLTVGLANPAFAHMHGYTPAELAGLPVGDLYAPESRAEIPRLQEALFKAGHMSFECSRLRKDGGAFPALVEATILYDAQNKPSGYLVNVLDITERKLAERALIESEFRFRTLFGGIMDALFVLGLNPDGTPSNFTEVNEIACRYLGYSRGELLGMSLRDVDAPDSGVDAAPLLKQLAEGKSVLFEQVLLAKDGQRLPVEISASSLILREQTVIISVVRDISARKRAEALLRASEAKYRGLAEQQTSILDTLPASVAILDRAGKTIKVNRAWTDFAAAIGLRQNHSGLGENYLQASDTASGEASSAEVGIRAVLEALLPRFELEYSCRLSGEWHWFRMAAVPLLAAGRPDGAILLHIDITERKQAELEILESHDQLRALSAHIQTVREEEKARIAREIHDDLGGTLTALKMDLHWLARALPAGKAMAPLQERTGTMSALLDAAVEATRRIITELRPSILDSLGLLATLEWHARQFQQRTGIPCRVHCSGDRGDLDRERSIALYRIFQEALTNIARHSGADKVDVEFRHDDDRVFLSVRDNGRGLADGHTAGATSYGLRGMAERADYLGGRIRLVNPPEGGLTVEASLPAHGEESKNHDKGKT